MTGIAWQPEALQDLEEAFHWYESQRPGLGAEFAVEVDALLNLLQTFPNAYPVVFQGLRRVLVAHFPFGLYYLVDEQRMSFSACFISNAMS